MNLLIGWLFWGNLFYIPLYLQAVREWSPTMAGIFILPLVIAHGIYIPSTFLLSCFLTTFTFLLKETRFVLINIRTYIRAEWNPHLPSRPLHPRHLGRYSTMGDRSSSEMPLPSSYTNMDDSYLWNLRGNRCGGVTSAW